MCCYLEVSGRFEDISEGLTKLKGVGVPFNFDGGNGFRFLAAL